MVTQGTLKVLLVEDSEVISSRISELVDASPGLEISGIVMTEATAIQQIRSTAPDVVVLDLRLKEGTGFGVLRALEASAPSHPPVIIVMTNYALPQYRNAAMHLGARYFLDKALEFDELPRILSGLSEARSAVAGS